MRMSERIGEHVPVSAIWALDFILPTHMQVGIQFPSCV